MMDEPVRFISTVQVGITVVGIALGAIGEPLVSRYFDFLPRGVAFVISFAVLTYLSVVARRARPEGGRAAEGGGARARARGADRRALARVRTRRLGAAALVERRAARARGQARAGRDDRVHARGHPALGRRRRGRRRDRDGRGGDALQGLRLRREGGGGRDGAAARRRRALDRAARRGGAAARARVAVHALPGLPGVARRHRRDPPRPRARLRARTTTAIADGRGSRSCCARPTSCPRRRTSARCSASSGARTSTWRSSSTSTARRPGIVTLEDLLEEIVGDIEDEFDLPDESVERVDETTIRIDGSFTIDDFNEQFGTTIDDEDFHTVAGFVFGHLGRAAEVGDEVVDRRPRASACSRRAARGSSGSRSSSCPRRASAPTTRPKPRRTRLACGRRRPHRSGTATSRSTSPPRWRPRSRSRCRSSRSGGRSTRSTATRSTSGSSGSRCSSRCRCSRSRRATSPTGTRGARCSPCRSRSTRSWRSACSS